METQSKANKILIHAKYSEGLSYATAQSIDSWIKERYKFANTNPQTEQGQQLQIDSINQINESIKQLLGIL